MLRDAFGRPMTDLRISVTERCNFRCFYCHNEGQGGPVIPPAAPHPHEMRVDEIERIVRVAAGLGVRHVKLTGGEPLVRKDLEEIVAACAQHATVSLTTNGSLLHGRAAALKAAGLERVNVSVDTLRPQEFQDIRGGELATVLRGVRASLEAGLRPVKLNLVLYRGALERLPDMIRFVGAEAGLELQLIQFMPEMAKATAHPVGIEQVHGHLAAIAQRQEQRTMHHRRRYLIQGAWVELVDPVNNPEFCMNCHRVRVTSTGELKGCINRNDDRIPTRGLDEAGVEDAFRRVVERRVPYYGVHVPLVRAA